VPSPRLDFVEAPAQVACDNCRAQLVPGAAYCERCGARTRKARRLVRLAIRVELLFFALVVVLVIAFTWIYAAQR
jgi:predicted amidophosphoribosyltransferase